MYWVKWSVKVRPQYACSRYVNVDGSVSPSSVLEQFGTGSVEQRSVHTDNVTAGRAAVSTHRQRDCRSSSGLYTPTTWLPVEQRSLHTDNVTVGTAAVCTHRQRDCRYSRSLYTPTTWLSVQQQSVHTDNVTVGTAEVCTHRQRDCRYSRSLYTPTVWLQYQPLMTT
jgi:hypothetical protein